MRPSFAVFAHLAAVAAPCLLPGHTFAQPTLLFPADQAAAVAPLLPQSSRAQFESLLNSSGYEDIASFSESNKYRRVGRAVGRLKIFSEDGRFATCTAWLIGAKYVLTNHHCVDAADFPNNRIASMRLEMGVLTNSTTYDAYAVRLPQIESSRELDFAVLEVSPSAAQKYGSFALSARDPSDSEELFIVHHPLGQPQSLSRFQCRAAKPAINGRSIRHLCNTQPGSSGSPILSDNQDILVGLHHAGAPVGAGANRSNAGIRLSAILKSSVLLSSMVSSPKVPDQQPPPTPPPTTAETHAIDICPKRPDKTSYFSVSFDGKEAYGWYQADTCRRFTGSALQNLKRVYIYDVGYWSNQYSADLPPSAPTANLTVCATVIDGAAPYYSFGQLGSFEPNGSCGLRQWLVPFYAVQIGKPDGDFGWRANILKLN